MDLPREVQKTEVGEDRK
jgi:hypothetical protein